ncbi:MAG: hypothetical protein IK038_02590 [Bacteroidaceae bacterium]|nr:hypothetical protein [Bacteroidaceae bacterium]
MSLPNYREIKRFRTKHELETDREMVIPLQGRDIQRKYLVVTNYLGKYKNLMDFRLESFHPVTIRILANSITDIRYRRVRVTQITKGQDDAFASLQAFPTTRHEQFIGTIVIVIEIHDLNINK